MRCKYCRATIAGDEICYRAQSGKYDRAYNITATEEVATGVVCMSCQRQRNRDEYEGRLNAITPHPANSEAEGYEPPPPQGNVRTAKRDRNV